MALTTKRTSSETGETSSDSTDLFGPDKSFGYLIRDVHRAFVRDLVRALEPYKLSGAQWAALRVLWEEQGLTQVQLAERMRTEKAALTTVLDTLERKNYIARSRDQNDRRKSNIYLTRAGQQLKEALLPLSMVVHSRAIDGLSPSELKTGRKVLERILANLTESEKGTDHQ
ncbi:MarR family transcriptional regulator [Paraburkholderia sediminicola]|uniref:MarR family winged helix-turn-helix transcriptional regulator n=1 Tax=Paraburkholderia sediminicola TaxID=458836 RepID=UPI0038B7D0FF